MVNLFELIWSVVKAVIFVFTGFFMLAGAVFMALVWVLKFIGEMFFIGAQAKFKEEMAKGQEDPQNKH